MSRFILGIDPGTTLTAYCLVKICEGKSTNVFEINQFGKVENGEMVEILHTILNSMIENENHITIAIEHLESYGMAVGKSTFETAYFIGRLSEICNHCGFEIERIYRHEEKDLICHSMKANDSTIKQALVDLFAEHPDKNHGKGTKKEPDYFYGFKADCWSAFAICYTWYVKDLLGNILMETKKTELDF